MITNTKKHVTWSPTTPYVPARSNCHDDSPIMQLPQIRSHLISQLMLRIEQCTIEVQCNHLIFYGRGSHYHRKRGREEEGRRRRRKGSQIPDPAKNSALSNAAFLDAYLAMAKDDPTSYYHAASSNTQLSPQSTHAYNWAMCQRWMQFWRSHEIPPKTSSSSPISPSSLLIPLTATELTQHCLAMISQFNWSFPERCCDQYAKTAWRMAKTFIS